MTGHQIVLYAYTVIYDVYVLGGQNRDPVDALRAGPKRGELMIKRRFLNVPDKSVYAELLDPQTGVALLTPLQHVRLVAMDHKGMTIEGTQSHQFRGGDKGKVEHFAQRWLCKMPGAKAELDTIRLLKRSAARLNRARVTGMGPDTEVDD